MMYFLKLWSSLIILSWSSLIAQSTQCRNKSDLSGSISSNSMWSHQTVCWTIIVGESRYVRISVTSFNMNSDCSQMWLKMTVAGTGEEFKFCRGDTNLKPVTALNNVTVEFRSYRSNIQFTYHIEDILCVKKDSFRCSKHICIPRSKVCDGVKDCEDGTDEDGCETGITTIEGVKASLQYGISWLKNERTSSLGWKRNTHRGVIALHLAGDTGFNETDVEEKLMAKQLELETSVVILRNKTNPYSSNQLSMYVNALLATCHNPRKFYGFDLIQLLKKQIEVSPASSQPAVYLALCNANETLSNHMNRKLLEILSNNSDIYPFILDVQAMALMALTCSKNAHTGRNIVTDIVDLKHINKTVQRFKKLQLEDGSFGNVYTTALVTQALLAAGEVDNKDWKLEQAVNYLMSHMNSSTVDFLSVYLTLPILNGKSLLDIGKVNCTGYERKSEDEDTISDIENKLGSKIQVQYSLYVGDEKDVIHTIYLKIAGNSTAYEIMELASAVDHKYKYRYRTMSGKMYVYEIAGITNDPEAGSFWLLYHSSSETNGTLIHSNDSPDRFFLQDGEHLIMWYKTVHI